MDAKPLVKGLFHAGVMVSDIDECLQLFHDALGMEVVFDARGVIQREKGLSGVDEQVMDVLILRGEGGADLEIHRYVEPAAKPRRPMNHSDLGSMHLMLKVTDIYAVVEKVQELGYELMIPVQVNSRVPGFKSVYFRGPDSMMIELQEGELRKPAE